MVCATSSHVVTASPEEYVFSAYDSTVDTCSHVSLRSLDTDLAGHTWNVDINSTPLVSDSHLFGFRCWSSTEVRVLLGCHAWVDSGYMFRSVNGGVWNIHTFFYVPVDLGSCVSLSPSS